MQVIMKARVLLLLRRTRDMNRRIKLFFLILVCHLTMAHAIPVKEIVHFYTHADVDYYKDVVQKRIDQLDTWIIDTIPYIPYSINPFEGQYKPSNMNLRQHNSLHFVALELCDMNDYDPLSDDIYNHLKIDSVRSMAFIPMDDDKNAMGITEFFELGTYIDFSENGYDESEVFGNYYLRERDRILAETLRCFFKKCQTQAVDAFLIFSNFNRRDQFGYAKDGKIYVFAAEDGKFLELKDYILFYTGYLDKYKDRLGDFFHATCVGSSRQSYSLDRNPHMPAPFEPIDSVCLKSDTLTDADKGDIRYIDSLYTDRKSKRSQKIRKLEKRIRRLVERNDRLKQIDGLQQYHILLSFYSGLGDWPFKKHNRQLTFLRKTHDCSLFLEPRFSLARRILNKHTHSEIVGYAQDAIMSLYKHNLYIRTHSLLTDRDGNLVAVGDARGLREYRPTSPKSFKVMAQLFHNKEADLAILLMDLEPLTYLCIKGDSLFVIEENETEVKRYSWNEYCNYWAHFCE